MCNTPTHECSVINNSEGWLECRAYLPVLIGEKEVGEKGFYGKNKYVFSFFGKTSGFVGEQTGDKKVCDNTCLCGCRGLFVFFMAIKLPWREKLLLLVR